MGFLVVVGLVLGIYALYCLYTIARSTYLTSKRIDYVQKALYHLNLTAQETNSLLGKLVVQGDERAAPPAQPLDAE